jgi:ribosomal protein S14
MTYVEAQVRNRRKLRDLAAEIGICKSSLSRHMRDCVGRREAVKHSPRAQKINLISCRVVTAWPIDGGFKLTLQTEYDSHGQAVENYGSTNEVVEIHANELRSTDVLCVVRYDSAREARNPKALVPDEPVAEEVSETNVDNIHVRSDAAPCAVGDREIKGCNTTINSEREPVTAAENQGDNITLKKECEHIWRDIAAGVKRCQNCAEQRNDFQTVGMSRADWDKKNNRRGGIPGMGRFG